MNAMQWLGNDDVLRLVLSLAVQVSLVLGATLCASWICRRRTAARHAVCLCGLCAALACPLTTVAARQAGIAWLSISWPAAGEPVPATVAAELATAPAFEVEAPRSADAGDATMSSLPDGFAVAAELEYGLADRAVGQRRAAPDPGASHASPTSSNVAIQPGVLATSLVVMVWFIGVVYLLLCRGRTAMQLRRIVRDSRSIIPASGGRQPADWTDITSSAPLLLQLRLAQVASSRTLPIPIVYGVFRPRIIIPESLLGPGAEDLLRDVLLHELSHVQRRDPLVHLLQRLATILYWPHPLVYFVDRQLSATCEDLCDNHVLQHRRPADYARTLLQLTEAISEGTCPQAALAMLPQWSSLEQRVAALLDPRRSTAVRNARWLNWLIAAGAVCACMAAAGIHAQNTATATTLAVAIQADNSDAAPDNTEHEPARRMIAGIVVDESGQPVIGATVRFASPPLAGTSSRTNANGHFELIIPGGMQRYRWILLANDTSGEMRGYFEVPDEDLGLELKSKIVVSAANRTTAAVRDAARRPVPGAIVTAIGGDIAAVGEAVTDETGTAVVRYPSQVGVVWLVARKDGVGFDYYENYAASLQRHYGPLPDAVQLSLEGTRSLACRVVDSSGMAISGASVTPSSFSISGKIRTVNMSGAVAVLTDDAGRAQFDWLPAKFEQGIGFTPYHTDYRDSDAGVIRPGDGVDELALRMRKLATIAGRVTDLDGRPAPGIRVIAQGVGEANNGGSATARTARDGAFRMHVGPEAAYMLSVSDDDFTAAPYSTELIDEGESIEDVHLTLIRGTLVTGRVTAGIDDAPVADAFVTMKLTGERLPSISGRPLLTRRLYFRARSDNNGRYAVRVPPGQYQLMISGGQRGEPHNVHVSEKDDGATIVIDHHFETPANRPLRGQVVRAADGAVVSKATLYLGIVGKDEFTTSIRALTDNDGRFSVEGYGARHLLYAVSADNSLAGLTVSGSDGAEIKLELLPAATAVGQLLDHNGQPLADVEVAGLVRSPDTVSQTIMLPARTDTEGRYRIPGVAVGARFYLLPQRSHFGHNPVAVIKSSGNVEIETFKVPRTVNADDADRIAASRERLVVEIDRAADASERSNLLRRALTWAEELLADKDRDPTVHENAVLLLTQLNARPADPDRKLSAIPFTTVYKPLLRALSDPKFAADTRAAAAEGLTRIVNDADDTVDGGGLPEEARQQIKEALAAVKESMRPAPPVRRSPD